MRRRTLIQSLLARIGLSWVGAQGSRLVAQSSPFPAGHTSTLNELAATVLPESLGRLGTDAIASQFAQWVVGYRPGAEMQTGYGFTRLRYKPASPAPRYLEQLNQLSGGALTQSDISARRVRIAEELRKANVQDLPFSPDGTHIASDLMSFYFGSSEANDLAYRADIGKDKCRGLKNSGRVPSPLKQDGASAKV